MGRGGEGRGGGGSLLLTKSRPVSISHPHHPSPLDRAGGGQGDRLEFGSMPGPSLRGPFPGVKAPGGARVSVPMCLWAWEGWEELWGLPAEAPDWPQLPLPPSVPPCPPDLKTAMLTSPQTNRALVTHSTHSSSSSQYPPRWALTPPQCG